MAKARNSFERMAREAAERLDAARATGEQLALLPDEPGRTAVEVGTGKPGRPKGSAGKGSSQMRKWLAERGYRMPEDVLAEIAGLASSDSAMITAMQKADQVLIWAYGNSAGGGTATPEDRRAMFMQIYAVQLRAVEALLPYGAAKASPDVAVQQSVTVNMPAAPTQADQARDVTPSGPNRAGRMVPADVARKMQEKQGLSELEFGASDDEGRTE